MDLLSLYANNPNVPHNDEAPSIITLNVAFLAVTNSIIILRVLVRWRIVKQIAAEDYLMIAAGLFATAFSAMNIVGTRYGLGKHVYDLNQLTLIQSLKKTIQTLWICQVMYASALTLVKLSIIASYHRIFPTKWVRLTMYTLASFIAAVWIINIFATIFQCTPVTAAWDFQISDKKCISVMKLYYFTTAFSILTDLLLCILPLPLFWKLKLPTREKVIVSVLFGFGLFASVASIMRITVLQGVQSLDTTIGAVPTLNWSVAEVGTGAICASLPCLKPLFKRLMPGMFVMSARRPGNTGPGLSAKGHGPADEAREMRPVTSDGRTKSILKNPTMVGTREFV